MSKYATADQLGLKPRSIVVFSDVQLFKGEPEIYIVRVTNGCNLHVERLGLIKGVKEPVDLHTPFWVKSWQVKQITMDQARRWFFNDFSQRLTSHKVSYEYK